MFGSSIGQPDSSHWIVVFCCSSFALAASSLLSGYENVILPLTADFWEKTLSVVPVAGDLRINAGDLDGRSYCGDSEFTEVPSKYIADGISNTDLVLFVSASPSPRFCGARTLAVAVACNFDQFDRPTAGAINVCLDNIELNDDGTSSKAVEEDYLDGMYTRKIHARIDWTGTLHFVL